MTETRPLGQIAYEAWSAAHGNPSSFPTWDQLPGIIHEKWELTARPVYWQGYDDGTCEDPK
jgi:hypothetical protein